jgi:hypothetical protein
MRKWNEATALATAYSNTKCKKRPDDLVTVAGAMKYLTETYGSKAVAEKLNISVEMIRQFLTVLDLPRKVKALFASRQIDSVDVAKELASLGDKKRQETTARAIVNSPSKDVRDIKRLIKTNQYRVTKAKKAVLDAKPKGLNIFLLDFDDDTMRKIAKEAKSRKIKPADLVRDIIIKWLETKRAQKN